MYYLWVCLFTLFLTISWSMNLVGLPGNWLMVMAAAIFAWFTPELSGRGLSWTMVFSLAGLALLGEALELVAGAAGVARGGSKRGALLAIVGSFVGGLFGVALGSPVPFLGNFVGAIVFASVGAMAGAVLGELWKGGKGPGETYEIGKAAFWGRLMGSLAKVVIGSLILGVAVVAALAS